MVTPKEQPERIMDAYKIAIYPGDGIGAEVISEAVKALNAEREISGLTFEFSTVDWGCHYRERTGQVVPDDYLDMLKEFDAILLGALGDPSLYPDHVTLRPLIEIRQSFDQYACLRPATLLPGVASPLRHDNTDGIDMMILRENSEGEYVDAGGFLRPDSGNTVAVQSAIHSRKGIERILRYGFELALRRRKKLTMATKSNALGYAMVLWDDVLEQVRHDYPEVSAEKCHVDALAMNFVRQPQRYDVVVASNLFGDILSDLAGAIVGGLGLAPSANINPEKRFPSLFEPVHGSALDIAGKGIANPIGAIRSAAMMLDFLGQPDSARRIERAVVSNLEAGTIMTPDLGGSAMTSAVGDDIAMRIEEKQEDKHDR